MTRCATCNDSPSRWRPVVVLVLIVGVPGRLVLSSGRGGAASSVVLLSSM